MNNNYRFDYSVLLKQGDLNIRHIADKSSLSVVDYDNILLLFTELAPSVSISLTRFIERSADRVNAKYLDNITVLLEKLGCNWFISDFYSILDTFGKGDWRSAAASAKKVTYRFNEFYSKVMSTKRPKAANISDDPSEGKDVPDMALSLKKYVQYLDSIGAEAERKPIILAVDDSPIFLKTVSSVLGGDYKVITMANPKMLEKVLSQVTPALFLLDYNMPEISGFDLVPIIRGYKEYKETPIVFLTAAGTIENVSAAVMLGACDFVVKPVQPGILRERIAKHIKIGTKPG